MVPQQDTKDYEIKTPATKHQNSRSNALFAFQEEVPPGREGLWNQLWRMAKHPNTKCHSIVTSKCFSFNVQYIPTMSVEVQPWPDGRYNLGGVGALAKPCHHMSHSVLILSEDHHHHQHNCSIHLDTQYVKWFNQINPQKIAQGTRVNCNHFIESICQNWLTALLLIKRVS